ncbi:hypothetical protein EG329_000054 [Mollisiaceae sp. DMI_Dod_QoI]|nr:hypothetical protein EG329_000054 [Helotiales sp. DMI_Dod_QoI]
MSDLTSAASSSSQPQSIGGSLRSKFKGRLPWGRKHRDLSIKQQNDGNEARTVQGHASQSTPALANQASLSSHALSADIETIPRPLRGTSNNHSLSTAGPVSTTEPLPIQELWNQAFDELKEQEENLVEEYEKCLRGDLATMVGLTVSMPGSKVERQEQMAVLLGRKIKQTKDDTWKLKFYGKDIPVKDLAQPVVGIIQWADDYISNALSANPYASIAWAGVSLLLPLALNPSKQAASFTKDLDYISDLIVRSKMRQDLYERYQSKGGNSNGKSLSSSDMPYRDTLKKLYIQILKFQATSICYLSKNGAFRLGLDVVKWNDWDSALGDVQTRENAFLQIQDIWKDVKYQEDCETIFRLHQEKMNVLSSMSGDMSGLRHAIEKAQEDTKRTELLKWLSSVDPSKSYNVGLTKVRFGTGNWLLDENLNFEHWKTLPNSFMWLNGKAGSGKSVLSSSIIRHLESNHQSTPDIAIAFFYFSFSDSQTQNVDEMLCSLIKQICARRPNTPDSVQSLAGYKVKGQRPDRRTLEDALVATIQGFTGVYVVVDALDECPHQNNEREILLESIERIRGQEPENLHLLCTSRRLADIEEVLDPMASSGSAFTVDLSAYKEAVDRDIGLHIEKRFEDTSFKSWSDEIKLEAKAALIEKADGMFQYVACQFDALKSHRAPAKIRAALKDLPEGLDDTYDRMLKEINPEYQKQVASTLKWLAYSVKPLHLDELAEIFILDHEQPVPFDESERFSVIDDVLSYLPGLVTKFNVKLWSNIEQRNKDSIEIGFAHFSIKEYLSSTRMAQPFFSTIEETSHLYITEACLAYHLQLSEMISVTKETIQQYALWEYAVKCMPDHLGKVVPESWTASIKRRVPQVFTFPSRSLLNIARIRDPTSAAKEFGTALQAAAIFSNDTVVKLLLEAGADANDQAELYGSALQAATFNENYDRLPIVRTLVDNGANVNFQGGFYGNALQSAAYANEKEVVELLLEKGADVNTKGGEYGSALQAAAANGGIEVIKLLLENGSNVNAEGGEYGSALQAAADALVSDEEAQDILLLLLDHGAHVNASGGVYGNALQAAIASDKLASAELFLSRGAKLDPPGQQWKDLLAVIKKEEGRKEANRLRKYQEDPDGYIEKRRQELEKRRQSERPIWEFEIEDEYEYGYEDEDDEDEEDEGEDDEDNENDMECENNENDKSDEDNHGRIIEDEED